MRIFAIGLLAIFAMSEWHIREIQPWMLLYIGPDLLLPFTSAIAAAVGVVLMFWHRLTGWIRCLWRTIFRRRA